MRIIAGRFRGKSLTSPADLSIRPTTDRVRESVFNILISRLGHDFSGLHVLDLFAGTGALGLEALSRGAQSAVFVDMGVEARGLIREHIIALGVAGQAKLLRRDATEMGSPGNMPPASLVFCDPPYGKGLGEKALTSAAANGWLANGALIVLEEDKAAAFVLPDGFTLENERTYGDTAIRLLNWSA